jgi:hypothetical protein
LLLLPLLLLLLLFRENNGVGEHEVLLVALGRGLEARERVEKGKERGKKVVSGGAASAKKRGRSKMKIRKRGREKKEKESRRRVRNPHRMSACLVSPFRRSIPKGRRERSIASIRGDRDGLREACIRACASGARERGGDGACFFFDFDVNVFSFRNAAQ